MHRTARSAFTLIELAITVAIIGILLAIAVPSFAGYRRGAQRDGCRDQMRSILAAIEEARLERDYDVLAALRPGGASAGSVAVLVSGTSSGNFKNRYLPESLSCPAGGAAYTISYDEDSDTWSVACPNAASKGHAL